MIAKIEHNSIFIFFFKRQYDGANFHNDEIFTLKSKIFFSVRYAIAEVWNNTAHLKKQKKRKW